jgi:hypothetical protein
MLFLFQQRRLHEFPPSRIDTRDGVRERLWSTVGKGSQPQPKTSVADNPHGYTSDIVWRYRNFFASGVLGFRDADSRQNGSHSSPQSPFSEMTPWADTPVLIER